MSAAPATCTHPRSEPVEVRSRETGTAEVVAHICLDCFDQLPAAWGCSDCEWVEERVLCEPHPVSMLGRPCRRHAA